MLIDCPVKDLKHECCDTLTGYYLGRQDHCVLLMEMNILESVCSLRAMKTWMPDHLWEKKLEFSLARVACCLGWHKTQCAAKDGLELLPQLPPSLQVLLL